MKKKISVSIEENAISQLNSLVKEGSFRNKSHVIEYALIKFINEKLNL